MGAIIPLKTFATNDVLTAADLNNGPYSDAVSADVTTDQATSSTSFTDLATTGPTISGLTLASGQGCLIWQRAMAINPTTGGGYLMGFAVSGVESLSAADANSAWGRSESRESIANVHWYIAGVTGSHTFTSKYKVEASGTANFSNRRIVIKKF